MFKREFEMRKPVCEWVLTRNLQPIIESAMMRNCDIVGVEFVGRPAVLKRMVAIELKLERIAEVIVQCQQHQWHASEVWAALPMDVAIKNAKRFHEREIGLIGVTPTYCEIVSEAYVYDREIKKWFRNAMFARRNEYKVRMQREMCCW